MNIAIVSYIYPSKEKPYFGQFVHEQAKELVKQGHKIVVYAPLDRSGEFEQDGVRVVRLQARGIFPGLTFNMKVRSRIRKNGSFDVIHAHFLGANAILLRMVANSLKIPFVVTAHGMDLCGSNWLSTLLIRTYLLFPNRIMAVSNFTASLAYPFVKKKKITVIHNGVDFEKLKPSEDKNKLRKRLGVSGKIILSVGNLVQRKGHDIILKAFVEILKKYPNTRYLIVGDGPERQNLRDLVDDLDLKKQVIFLGAVSNKEIANYFNACDVFVLMSTFSKKDRAVEGFGVAYIEASALGKPVIGGKTGGTSDAIVDGVTGYLVYPSDFKALVSKIEILLNDSKLAKKLGENGKKRVISQFLWKYNAQKTIEVYKKARSNIYNSKHG